MDLTSFPYSHQAHSRDFEPTANYTALRERCPLHHEADHDPPFYVLSRFDDVVATVRQPEMWINSAGPGVFFQDSGVLGTTDDPDHLRHRQVLRAAFLPTVIQRLAPRISRVVDELLDPMIPLLEGDFVELFGAPFPALVIAELLGVPSEDREEFRHCSDQVVNALTGNDVDRYQAAKAALEQHIANGMAERDRQLDAAGPTEDALGTIVPDDVISRLAIARRGGVLSNDEARHIGYQLLVAGHETTSSLIGMMLYRLLERPALMAQLRAEPELLPNAIEEALRFDSPVHGLFRTNVQDCVVHGETLPAGTKVQMLFASANRDPHQFGAPDEFVIGRDRHELGRHVAFGWGIHHCIGAPLARLETRLAFEAILQRMSTIELAGPAQRNDSFVLHGLTSLPVRWTVADPAANRPEE